MRRHPPGFVLLEFLVALLVMSIVLAGAVGALATQRRTLLQQDLAISTEANLRVGMEAVTDHLRNSTFGVPLTSLVTWVPWVTGFLTNPQISLTSPATVSVAGCTGSPIATLSARADPGATTISVTSAVTGSQVTSLLNTTNRGLILINNTQNALLRSVTTSSLQIDTDPVLPGNQGLQRGYPAGTPICRVEVRTFSIQTDPITGIPWLGMDLNQGGGIEPVADGISNLAVATLIAGTQYQVTLTARSTAVSPITGSFLTRSLTSNVTIKK